MHCTGVQHKYVMTMNHVSTNEILISIKKKPMHVSLSAFNTSRVVIVTFVFDSFFNESYPYYFKGTALAISDTRTLLRPIKY